MPLSQARLRHNRIHIQIATIFFGVILFFAILSNVITSTVIAQVSPPATLPAPSQKSPTVKITSPTKGQQVPVAKDLTISGTSIDNATSDDCKVSVRVNKISPYQPATATGTGGVASKDYSKWRFVLTSKYTTINPGQNRITAKYECANNPALTAFSSVNVNGVPAATAATGAPTSTTTTNAAAKQPLQQQQEPVTANNNNNTPTSTSTSAAPQQMPHVSKGPLSSSISNIAPQVKTGPSQTNTVNEVQQQPRRLTTGAATTTSITPTQSSSTPRQPPITETANSNPVAPSTLSLAPKTKELSVLTDLAKDYISRGDTQFVTITVSNSTSNEKIAGADINANIHNANGLIKTHYTGTTDSSGQALFSLKISPKTNPGLYAIEVNATASGYDPNSNTRVFEVNQ